MIAGPMIAASFADAVRSSFSRESCSAFLANAQNPDGGWGFKPGADSTVEPTCWAVLALQAASRESSDFEEPVKLARRWLCAAQLPDGSWPAFIAQTSGCWLTSLASIALCGDAEFSPSVARGAQWVCDSWPAEGGLWWRVRRWLRPEP